MEQRAAPQSPRLLDSSQQMAMAGDANSPWVALLTGFLWSGLSASRSLTRYFNSTTGAINDEGFWAFELVDALDDLSRVGGNPLWRARIITALEWLHANRRDPNGHYGRLWGRGGFQATALFEWHLNDQASVARSYLHTGLAMLAAAALPGDYNLDGGVDAADYVVWRKDPNRTLAQYDVWRSHFGQTAGSGSDAKANTAVPEPTTMVMLIVAVAGSYRRQTWAA